MIELIGHRLQSYQVSDSRGQEHALKEILQELALYALWRAGFFKVAAFQGGTALRILHQLPRFSEDLDFILQEPDPNFEWSPYLNRLLEVLADFGVDCELVDRTNKNRAVRHAMLKDDSIGRQLDLSFFNESGGIRKKLKVKLEIDTNPPEGSCFEYSYLDFPLDFELTVQDLPSNFALKIHALLCRPYLKGRDWFDFGWYIRQGVTPNISLIAAALAQSGPWAQQQIEVNREWLQEALKKKIQSIDWQQAAEDVAPFLISAEQASLTLWSERFFINKLEKL
ncbi:MAG: nucleotidyl transferase AbiEii/AbiGii toxin family protein [Gammaproteobacteria bacterium]|uniref:Nucleotidyl transferase AbiEii/AbiGii toxin family protein n=1 Tax=Candidatus Thiopontia autotrophica TaxID=2841688 RepID=A0A8J6TMY4_9GAMM|nr:nucleotidyl transferase AbiEii/AbiGii toxin family protein [Candidatus Thiopontia autotrophica]MBL6985341.1 nucleotidyl transferase AbiEii/AbiGii toxin family protein [Candidatus Thioglobus sp.]